MEKIRKTEKNVTGKRDKEGKMMEQYHRAKEREKGERKENKKQGYEGEKNIIRQEKKGGGRREKEKNVTVKEDLGASSSRSTRCGGRSSPAQHPPDRTIN